MQVTQLSAVRTFAPIEIPVPVAGAGDALIRVKAVSICGSDLSSYLGSHPRIKAPTILGHEATGVVEAIGSDVTGVAVGDRVCIDPTSGCGTCRHCLAGFWNRCSDYTVLGETEAGHGALAGLIAVPAVRLHALPANVPFDVGAIVQPLSVAFHAARDQGHVAAGQTILICGAGPIGLGVLLAAKAVGATAIITDLLEYRLEMARSLGADVTVNPGTEDLEKIVMERTGGYGVDTAYESIGGGSDRIFFQAVQLTAAGGRIVVIGLKTPAAELPMIDLKYHEKTVIGSQAHPNTFPEMIARISDGSIPAGRLITHRFGWDRVPEAFELLARRGEAVMKIVIVRDDA